MLNLLATKIDGLEIAYIAVGILLGIAIIAAFIAQIVIAIGYWRGNRTNNSLGLSGGEYARKLLDQNGMPDVQVKKCGIIRTILFGNHYSITKRTVYLRMRTINKPSLTAVAMAAQKVALAEQHRDGDTKMIVRSRLQGLGVFAPILFVPLVLIGFLVDIFVLETLLFSLVTAGIGLLFILFGFIVTLLNIPVEKKAMERAQVILENELTGEEMVTVKKIFRSYLVEYVLQFIIAILRIIQLILKKTARSDSYTGTCPNPVYGYGKIDALAGIGEVLSPSGIDRPTSAGKPYRLYRDGILFTEQAGRTRIVLTSPDGIVRYDATVETTPGSRIEWQATGVPAGLYIVRIGSHGEKVLVR